MQRIMSILGLGLGLLAATACTTALPPEKTPALGGAFNQALKDGYLRLADAEHSEGDLDLFHFRSKAKDAMVGDVVWPDRVGDHAIPADVRTEALTLRAQLIDLLQAGARTEAPESAAKAQVAFDCWLEELDGQEAAVESSCKTALDEALAETLLAFVEPGATYLVLFEAGKDQPSGPARSVITDAARAVRLLGPAQVHVIGYTDPSGTQAANRALSLSRAQAVADGLVRSGVAEDVLVVEGRGTAAGDDRAAQRRVEISFSS
jgi:outer membrane protein OmpA-like peptidoglycan-associated protein